MVKKKSIYSILKTLEKHGAITILNEIEDTKVKIKKAKFVALNKTTDEIYALMPEIEKRSSKQIVILLELLNTKEKDLQQSELLKKTNSNQSSINSLAKKGIVKVFDKEVERVYTETYSEEHQDFNLTPNQ